jgi:hypothetical protein
MPRAREISGLTRGQAALLPSDFGARTEIQKDRFYFYPDFAIERTTFKTQELKGMKK